MLVNGVKPDRKWVFKRTGSPVRQTHLGHAFHPEGTAVFWCVCNQNCFYNVDLIWEKCLLFLSNDQQLTCYPLKCLTVTWLFRVLASQKVPKIPCELVLKVNIGGWWQKCTRTHARTQKVLIGKDWLKSLRSFPPISEFYNMPLMIMCATDTLNYCLFMTLCSLDFSYMFKLCR